MPYCAKLKTEFSKIYEEVKHLRNLLSEFKKTGEKEKVEEIRRELALFRSNLEKFKENYKRKVQEMMVSWWGSGFRIDNEGRVIVEKGIDLWGVSVPYFPTIIRKVEGSIDLTGIKEIEKLGSLEEVEGDLICFKATSLKSLENLKRVEGMLDLEKTGIGTEREGSLFPRKKRQWTLESLEEVGGLWVAQTSIEDFRETFPRLKKVGNVWGTSILIDETQDHLRDQIKELIRKGEIKLEGKISSQD